MNEKIDSPLWNFVLLGLFLLPKVKDDLLLAVLILVNVNI